MKQLFFIVLLLVTISACNNGGYDTNPDNDSDNCPAITDTVCSCTDSFSWYRNGILYSAFPFADHNDDNTSNIGIYGEVPGGEEITMFIKGYSGPGTYDITLQNMHALVFADEDLNPYVTNTPCAGGRIVVTEDAGGYIKGTFYARVKNAITGEFTSIKGGKFNAPWLD